MSPILLVVTDKYAPHAGGTATLWTEWCRNLPPEHVRVITRQFSGWKEFDCRQDYSVSRASYFDVPKLRMPLVWAQMFVRTAQECRKQACVVHCCQILETGWFAPWLKRRQGIRYIVHTYGEELSTRGRDPRLLRRMQEVLAGADGVTAISRNTERILRSRLAYLGPVEVVLPGVDSTRFVPGTGGDVRARLGIRPGPLLLTVSRLTRRKGHDRVLEAMPAILARCPNAQYVIAGHGPEQPRLQALAAASGVISHVTFVGRVSNADIVLLMQAADVFVHPNRELENGDLEGFGLVLLEANACGTPVIAGNSGGAPEAIDDGATGFLVDPNRPQEIASRVIELLEDAPRRTEMGEAGREWAAKFTWQASAEKVWRLSQRVAQKPN